MNLNNLNEILAAEPAYRLKQAREAVFVNLIEDWQEASNLPASLRDQLNERCPLAIKADLNISQEQDSIKAAVCLDDGCKIETVLLKHNTGRNTVCLSSQVGCALGCKICLTGKMGFARDLTADEIVEQVLLFSRLLKKENKIVNNLVFMGMGEPFLNYDNVLAAINLINSPTGLNIGARHISISTIGVVEGIKKLAGNDRQINLAVSLHAPNDEIRVKIVPSAKVYPLAEIIKAINFYIARTKRRVMIEYVMIKGFNDSPALARQLAVLLQQINPNLYFVNLIAYNPGLNYQPSSPAVIKQFKKILASQKIEATERQRFGQDIEAACGQLAGNK